MIIKSKITLIFIILSIMQLNVAHAHPGHGSADAIYFHYLLNHDGNHYSLIFLFVFILLVLRASIKR